MILLKTHLHTHLHLVEIPKLTLKLIENSNPHTLLLVPNLQISYIVDLLVQFQQTHTAITIISVGCRFPLLAIFKVIFFAVQILKCRILSLSLSLVLLVSFSLLHYQRILCLMLIMDYDGFGYSLILFHCDFSSNLISCSFVRDLFFDIPFSNYNALASTNLNLFLDSCTHLFAQTIFDLVFRFKINSGNNFI